MAKPEQPPPCPCGNGKGYAACCAPLHQGAPAADAEALMRSRYSAYVLGLEDYLLASWHPTTRPAQLNLQDDDPPLRWLGLEIKRHLPHVANDPDRAIVEFVARYKQGGRAQRLHEISRFVREDGHWYYLEAENNAL